MERYRTNFWDNIDARRVSAGLSWSRMATQLGINYVDLLQSKRNLNLPRIDRLKKFADVLGCLPEDLIKGIFDEQ